MTKKLIQILGGSYNQKAIVQAAKDLGHQVLVCDINENPPCKELADFYEQVDIKDLEANLEIAKKYQIDAICTDQTDISVPVVAKIAEELKLPGIGYNTACKFTNKKLMKDSLLNSKSFNFKENVPKNFLAKTKEEALKLIEESKHRKLILKPVDSQGSRGVVIIDQANIDSGLIEKAFAGGFGAGISVEEFIEGKEFAVDSFVEAGEIYNLAVASKEQYPNNPCLDKRFNYLGDLEIILEKQLFELQEKIIKEFELENGCCHGEYKVKADGTIVLIEIAARGAGSNINGIINPFLTDFDINKAIIRQCLGQSNEIKISNYKEKFAAIEWLDYPSGRIQSIELSPEAKEIAADIHLKASSELISTSPSDSRDRLGYIIINEESSKEALESKLDKVKSLINVKYAD